MIQRNAIESWTHLRPRPEIILMGEDEGTMDLARELRLRHVPQVACSDHGTPLLSDLFRQAKAAASWPCMCYVNADIILLSDFLRAVEIAQRNFSKSLMVSKRINLGIVEKLNFEISWEETIKAWAGVHGKDEHHTGIDVFVFPKEMYPEIPDFAIGRLWFDHWLIKAVREQNLPVVDASLVAPVIHQEHDYNHVRGGREEVWRGQEAERNLQLYGGIERDYTLLDVTHELIPDGSVRRVRFRKPLFKIKQFAWEIFVRRTALLRRALGLRKKVKQPADHQIS